MLRSRPPTLPTTRPAPLDSPHRHQLITFPPKVLNMHAASILYSNWHALRKCHTLFQFLHYNVEILRHCSAFHIICIALAISGKCFMSMCCIPPSRSNQYVMAIKRFTAHPDNKPTRGWVSAMGKIQHYKKAVKSSHVFHPEKKGLRLFC